jgi:hypothetical protein
MTKLSLLAALSLAIGACLIVDDDDGGGSETSNSSNATTQSTTATTASSNSGTDGTSSGSSASGESTAADGGTSAGGGCGWGPTGEADVPEGYVCGGNGEDPSGMIPSACPEGIELVEGGDCGGNMGITGVGCCDASGNAWFCAGQDGASQLYTQPC